MPLLQLGANAAGLGAQELWGITASVIAPMEAQIGPVGGQAPGVTLDHVMDAQRHPIGFKKSENLFVQPARIAELEDPAQSRRQGFQKSLQPSWIGPPTGWELHQYGPQVGSQAAGPFDKGRQALLRLPQPFDVAAVAAELEGIEKPRPGALPPTVEYFGSWQAVEGIVDLHRVEVRLVVVEPAALRQVCRIDRPAPVWILIARGPDEQPAPHRVS